MGRSFNEIYEDTKKKAKTANDEDIKSYAKIIEVQEVWDDIINDSNVPDDVANIAKMFKGDKLDLTRKEHLNLFKFKIEGQYGALDKYEACDFEPKEMNKENALAFIKNIMDNAKNGVETFYFLGATSGGNTFVEMNNDTIKKGFATNGMYLREPKRPKAVNKPGFFKGLTNKLFGWFKEEHDNYHQYEEKLAKYNQDFAKFNKRKQEMDIIVNEMKDITAETGIKVEQFKNVINNIKENKTVEQRLEDRFNTTKKYDRVRNLTAGRSTELLDRMESYKNLSTVKLVEHKTLPMAGLAILTSSAKKAHLGISDASSTGAILGEDKGQFTEAEKKQFEDLKDLILHTDNGTKVYQTYYKGSDVHRMGARAEGVFNARKLLNEAVLEYDKGNKEPLIDLINDSLPSLYNVTMSNTSGLNDSEGLAEVEAIKGLFDVMEMDPDIKKGINISEEKLNTFKGFVKLVDTLSWPDKKILEDYKKDMGPNSPERREAIDDLIFRDMLMKNYKKEKEDIVNEACLLGDEYAKGNGIYTKEFIEKLGMEKHSLSNMMNSKAVQMLDKTTNILKEFSKENFDLAKFKESILSPIRNTDAYKEMLNLDKDNLYPSSKRDSAMDKMYKEIQNKIKVNENSLNKNIEKEKVKDVNVKGAF